MQYAPSPAAAHPVSLAAPSETNTDFQTRLAEHTGRLAMNPEDHPFHTNQLRPYWTLNCLQARDYLKPIIEEDSLAAAAAAAAAAANHHKRNSTKIK